MRSPARVRVMVRPRVFGVARSSCRNRCPTDERVAASARSAKADMKKFSGKAPVRWWDAVEDAVECAVEGLVRAPQADPSHPGCTVVAAIDQYVSTTAIIISRGPTLVRKAVLEQTLRGVEDVLWRT